MGGCPTQTHRQLAQHVQGFPAHKQPASVCTLQLAGRIGWHSPVQVLWGVRIHQKGVVFSNLHVPDNELGHFKVYLLRSF